MNPLGKTTVGVTVWAMPNRVPGQRTGLQHLTWAGPGDSIHLWDGGLAQDRVEWPGHDTGAVSGPCKTAAEAQQTVDAYIAGPAQRPAAAVAAHRPARTDEPTPAQLRSSIVAPEAPAMTPRADDETARILAEHGTPEKLLDYLLMEADRHKREAYAAAWAQCEADGKTPAAKERYDAAYWAAYDRWETEVASLTAEYAHAINASAPSVSTDDPASPHNQGLLDGTSLHARELTRYRSRYDDVQWREYVAGFAEALQAHAEETSWYARAVMKQGPESPAEPLHDTASSAKPTVSPAFAGAPVRPATSSGRRAAGRGIASWSEQAHPGRRR